MRKKILFLFIFIVLILTTGCGKYTANDAIKDLERMIENDIEIVG